MGRMRRMRRNESKKRRGRPNNKHKTEKLSRAAPYLENDGIRTGIRPNR